MSAIRYLRESLFAAVPSVTSTTSTATSKAVLPTWLKIAVVSHRPGEIFHLWPVGARSWRAPALITKQACRTPSLIPPSPSPTVTRFTRG